MEPQKSDKPKVLVVDDVDINLEILRALLSAEDLQVFTALNGNQALSSAESVQPDLVLLDINMPGMNGFEVCRLLKSNEKTSEIPVIFLTAVGENEAIQEGFNVGAVDYVTKPFVAPELLARVRTHIELKRSRDERERHIAELKMAMAEIQTLRGIIPICANCKKVRDDRGFWQQVERYVADRSDAQFSHGICPGCVRELYPNLSE